nr:hypothetical protein [Pandoravirus massiliensis]
MACVPCTSRPVDPAPITRLPVEMLAAIVAGALDVRWQFCARRVCRSWRDIVDAEAARKANADCDIGTPRSRRVLASAVVAAYDGAPHEMVDFCLASAAHMYDCITMDGVCGRRRPVRRRDVLLALLASAIPGLVDYAVDRLSAASRQTSAPSPPPQLCRRNAVDNVGDNIVDDHDNDHDDVCDVNSAYGDHTVDADDNDFYKRIGDIVVRTGDAALMQALAARMHKFHPTRHVDPLQVINVDAADILRVIDPPAGAFWRSGHATAVRACRMPGFWHEAGRAGAVSVIAFFQSESSSATAAECAPAAARAAVAHGCTGVLDLLAAHKHTRPVVSRPRLAMLCRRAAAACNPRGFAWCVRELNAVGSRADPVDAATDAVMGPWRENEPCAPWDTQKAVAFLRWLHTLDSEALRTPVAIVEIIHCATLPRRPMGDRERRAHTHAVAECLAQLSPREPADTSQSADRA